MPRTKAKRKQVRRRPVKKALSAEEQTLLSNIKSMVSELESIGAGEAAMSEDEDVEVNVIPDEEDEDLIGKARDEGPTGRDKADERLEETDEESEKNISAVKSLIEKMDRSIAKSNVSNRNLLQAVVGLTKVVKSIDDRLSEQEAATVHIIEGLNLGEAVEKSIKPDKKPVQATDTEQVLKSLLGIAAQAKEDQQEAGNTSNEVRKSLANRQVLAGLLGQ